MLGVQHYAIDLRADHAGIHQLLLFRRNGGLIWLRRVLQALKLGGQLCLLHHRQDIVGFHIVAHFYPHILYTPASLGLGRNRSIPWKYHATDCQRIRNCSHGKPYHKPLPRLLETR